MVVYMITREAHDKPGSATHSTSHEHGWCVESSHPTSMGRVLYVRCATCGARRVDLRDQIQTPPVTLSRACS